MDNVEYKEKIFNITLGSLKEMNKKLWVEIALKLGKIYLQKKDFDLLKDLIAEVKKEQGLDTGKYDPNETNLLEVLALEI